SSRRRCRLRLELFAGCCEAFECREDRYRYAGVHRRAPDDDSPDKGGFFRGPERSERSGPSRRRTATRRQPRTTPFVKRSRHSE
ncbi:unnamed protein product, partial [Ectocarpus sp. 12 AP-2014]